MFVLVSDILLNVVVISVFVMMLSSIVILYSSVLLNLVSNRIVISMSVVMVRLNGLLNVGFGIMCLMLLIICGIIC